MVSGLPEELRETVVLRYFQNVKYTDILCANDCVYCGQHDRIAVDKELFRNILRNRYMLFVNSS